METFLGWYAAFVAGFTALMIVLYSDGSKSIKVDGVWRTGAALRAIAMGAIAYVLLWS